MKRQFTYTIPSNAPVEANTVQTIALPFLPYKGSTPVRSVKNSSNSVIFDAYNIENDTITEYIDGHTYTWGNIYNGSYNVISSEGRNVTTTIVNYWTVLTKGSQRYYSYLNTTTNKAAVLNFEDYIAWVRAGMPTDGTYETTDESWGALPRPIAVNAENGNLVKISSSYGQYYVPSAGKCTLVYNLIPGVEYTVQVLNNDTIVSTEVFTVTGRIRLIYLPLIMNVRDIGGWECYDNNGNVVGTVAYNRIIRGRHIDSLRNSNTDARNILLNQLGVNVELDVRDSGFATTALTGTELYSGTNYKFDDDNVYEDICNNTSVKSAVKRCLTLIANKLEEGKILYVHCTYGMDRAGVLCAAIEGICGCSLDAIIKDWEMSSLSLGGGFDSSALTCHRIDVGTQLLYWIKYLHNTYGTNNETINEQINSWLINDIGLTSTIINKIKNSLVVPANVN